MHELRESTASQDDRSILRGVRRLVVKIGTRVLSGEDRRFDQPTLDRICLQLANVHGRGIEVLLVSSGAVGLGAQLLEFDQPPSSLEERQACAAVGQSRLMRHYESALGALGLLTGQVLLTESDFDDRDRYLNLRSTLTTMLSHRVIPIINENDAVSVAELAYLDNHEKRIFGDNDHLSSLVATKLEADLLLLLTDVEGVFDRDPRAGDATLLPRLAGDEDLEENQNQRPTGEGAWGRGGISSKIRAADIAARSGCHAVVAPGYDDRVIERVLNGEEIGSWLPARGKVGARRRWIAFAARPQGTLTLDGGAVGALREGASLLAPGVSKVDGEFQRGDVVELRAEDGQPVGRGMIYCDSDASRRWCAGERPAEARNHHALVHRDHMVLEEWVLRKGG